MQYSYLLTQAELLKGRILGSMIPEFLVGTNNVFGILKNLNEFIDFSFQIDSIGPNSS